MTRAHGPLAELPYDQWPDEDLDRREDELLDAIRAVEPELPTARLPSGATLTIASPCPERWSSMVGDDRVRHCGRCQKNVYNLGAMSPEEVDSLFRTQEKPCVRMFKRADGGVMTADCRVGLPKRVVLRVVGALAVAVGAVGFAEGLESRMFRGLVDSGSSSGAGITNR
jgi:hypothetical protein